MITHVPDTPKTNTFWDKITSSGEGVCFVCDHKFKSHHRKRCIGRHKYNGELLFRHEYCESGSNNWKEKFGGRLYLVEEKKETTKEKEEINVHELIDNNMSTKTTEQPIIRRRKC